LDDLILSRYRDIEISGKTLADVLTEIGAAFADGCHLADLRCLAGTLAEPEVFPEFIAGEMCEIMVDRFGPGDRIAGVLVV
jgi:hypothetical protein